MASTIRGRTIVDEPLFGTKDINFRIFLKTFVSKVCILKKHQKTFVSKFKLKIFEGFEIVSKNLQMFLKFYENIDSIKFLRIFLKMMPNK